MKEIRKIIEAYDHIDRSSTKAALATVVNVEGSSYRRTGARMLVMDNGAWVGGISGGCLEGDALKKARFSIVKSKATLITYDTTQDDPYQIGVGLGCNGVITVLITPINFSDKNNPIEVLRSCTASRKKNIVMSVTDTGGDWQTIEPGYSFRYDPSQKRSVFKNEELETHMRERLDHMGEDQKSMIEPFELSDGRHIALFFEIIKPEIHLVLMGHQYDIFPMAVIAKEIGWQLTVVSNPAKITRSVSMIADRVLSIDQFTEIEPDDQSAIVLMSHDYKTDKLNLAKALNTTFPYIGMLGPRVRAERIFRELKEDGLDISDKDLDRIFAPAGLDIGATSPEEIALSVAAEIKAAFENRNGGFLKHRKTTIHERNRVQSDH